MNREAGRLNGRVAAVLIAALVFGYASAVAARVAPSDRRVALFQAEGFPTADAPAVPPAVLAEAMDGLPADTFADPAGLAAGLNASVHAALVLPYGSAFPLEAWDAIRAFLDAGGGLVVLGGAPFHQPVYRGADGGWVAGVRQPTFAHALLIGPSEAIDLARDAGALTVGPAVGGGWDGPAFPLPARAFALTVRFATRPDTPGEDGAAGIREAVLRPLVHIRRADDPLPVACPLLEIDRLHGPGAGGRWVLAPCDAALPAPLIRAMIRRALDGAMDVTARPVTACVEPGEVPRVRITVRRPGAAEGADAVAVVTVSDDAGQAVWRGRLPLAGIPAFRTGELAIRTDRPLAPGLYRVAVMLEGAAGAPRNAESAFWVRDDALLATGPRLTASRDWLRRDGRVFPVVGTTYMAGDVHRKFLFEPNPAVWDRDMAAMRRAGVNFIRTGIWTGWGRLMSDPGAADENALCALDAFVLTAARHDLAVCFTFFAFRPPLYGGDNPYLDPRALAGQEALLALVASRYRGVGWIHWDLINEPSYAPADALWTNRPIGDAFEAAAWAEWVRRRHGEETAPARDRWRDAGPAPLAVPAAAALAPAMVREERTPVKGFDFRLFTQDVVAGWAARLRAVLRAAGGDALVTLGQDEAGAGLSPSPQFHGEAVDYTAIHTWWSNDDLLWDAVVSKVPEKPCLVQETGLMRLEDADGFPWRTPEAAAQLLERKYALAFAGRAAGAVEWAWNVNPYQPLDNEAVIGLVRPDGTAKPELRVLCQFATFFAVAAPRLDDWEPDPVVLVLPHARMFSGRTQQAAATRRAVRVLADRFGVVPTALADLKLAPARLASARLVLVPVPELMDETAAASLRAAAAAGARVLVTGAVTGDPYGRVTAALAALEVVDPGRPVALREPLDGGWATFDETKGEWFRAALSPRREGAAAVWHEPLPLELAREEAPLAALYGRTLAAAGLPSGISDMPMTARVLLTPAVALVVCVNESSADAVRAVDVDGRRLEVPVPAGRSRLVLWDRAARSVIAQTPGPPVVVP